MANLTHLDLVTATFALVAERERFQQTAADGAHRTEEEQAWFTTKLAELDARIKRFDQATFAVAGGHTLMRIE